MIRKIKNIFSIYRRFEIDIWGIYALGLERGSRTSRFFTHLSMLKRAKIKARNARYTYRIDKPIINIRSKKIDRDFITRRVTKIFFMNFSFYQFQKMYKIANRKLGNFTSNFVMMLEGRFSAMLYRVQFITSFFHIDKYLEQHSILLDGARITDPNSKWDLFQVISADWRDYEIEIKKKKFSFVKKKNEFSDYLGFSNLFLNKYIRLKKKKKINFINRIAKTAKNFKSFHDNSLFSYKITKISTRSKVRKFLIWRQKKNKIFFSPPRFMYMDYSLMMGFMIKYPQGQDLAYPIYLDIFRAADLR